MKNKKYYPLIITCVDIEVCAYCQQWGHEIRYSYPHHNLSKYKIRKHLKKVKKRVENIEIALNI
ncbi:MAG: hypothetical protein ACXADA_08375 [Candidatus Hodarchaeales archaeon]